MKNTTTRTLLCLTISLLCSAPALAQQDAPPALSDREQLMAKLRTDLEQYYARAFSEPLKQKNRLARLIGVASLAKIDATPLTEKLLEAAEDKDLIVAQVAWEALHARHASLDEPQRKRWIDAGLAAKVRGAFPGQTGLNLTAAIAGYGVPAEPKVLADLVGDAANPETTEKLSAVVVQLFQTQPNRQWLRMLVSKYVRGESDGNRIDAVLRKLPDAPAKPEKAAQLTSAWDRYVGSHPMTEPQKPSGYKGSSEAFAKPEKIDNPEGTKWRRELELPHLPTERIELVYVIDSTGSMVEPNKLLAATLHPLTMSLGLCANDVRTGVAYYRHESVPALQKACCKKAMTETNNHLTRTLPLTREVDAIVNGMRNFYIDPKAGHDKGSGAYAAGLEAAIKLDWGSAKISQKIVIVIGDALPTDGTVEYATKIAGAMKEKGVRLYFLSLNKEAATAVEPIANAGGQAPLVFAEDMKLYAKYTGAGKPLPLTEAIKSNVGRTVTNVIRDSVPKEYADRIDAIFSATLPILQATLDKQRVSPMELMTDGSR